MEAAQRSHSRAWLELKAYTGHTATWESKREGTNTEAMRKGLELKLMADCSIELNSFMFPNSCELLGIVISRSFYKLTITKRFLKSKKKSVIFKSTDPANIYRISVASWSSSFLSLSMKGTSQQALML